MKDKVRKIREEVEKRFEQIKNSERESDSGAFYQLKELLEFIDSLQEEPVSEDLEETSKNYALNNTPWDDCKDEMQDSFKAGAKWQKAKDESTTEDLGEYINELSKQFQEVSFAKLSRIAVRVANWQKENIWKPADGDDLPETDREVIAILDNGKVVFVHRPNPNGWDGKSITTGKAEHFVPQTYGDGGWNIPDVKYWLDYDINELLCREK